MSIPDGRGQRVNICPTLYIIRMGTFHRLSNKVPHVIIGQGKYDEAQNNLKGE